MRAVAVACAALSLCTAACSDRAPEPPTAQADCGAVEPPSGPGDFGAPGSQAVSVHTLPNPLYPQLDVTVYLPASSDADARAPVILFAHANGLEDPSAYRALIDHMASRGNAVIHSPYMIGTQVHRERYEALWAGVQAAVAAHGARLDLTRVGFVGHSYGAGALPYLALRALVREGWGTTGAFLYSMAPWYPLFVSDAELAQLPADLLALTLVFEADDVNDHRIAIELHRALPMPDDRKSYLLLVSDARGGCALPALHSVPQSGGLGGRDDAFDRNVVARLFDAVAAAAFSDSADGRRVAFGRGGNEQVATGRWPDGAPIAPLVWREVPEPVRPESFYLFQLGDREGWERYGDAPASTERPAGGRTSKPDAAAPAP